MQKGVSQTRQTPQFLTNKKEELKNWVPLFFEKEAGQPLLSSYCPGLGGNCPTIVEDCPGLNENRPASSKDCPTQLFLQVDSHFS